MIKVIYVVGHLRTGGPILQIAYVIANLDRRLFTPVVIVTSAVGETTIIERWLERAGVEVVRVKAGRLTSVFKAMPTLMRMARKEKYFVLHPYGLRSDIISWMSRLRPRLGNVRSHTRQNFKLTFGTVVGSIVSTVYLRLLDRADIVVACSDAVRDDLKKDGIESVVIHNAIDMKVYNYINGADRGCDIEVDNGKLKRYITVSSRIPGKNTEFLVEQFARSPEWERSLTVIGWIDPKLIEKYRWASNVTFIGHTPTPSVAIANAHYFISASLHEGMPNAALEALSFGRPVILSNISAHTELLSLAGSEVGCTFSWNRASLEGALNDIESRNYNDLRTQCLRSARTQFDPLEMSLKYQELYRTLAKWRG